LDRAVQIFQAHDRIEVLLEGNSVWIEEVDEGNGMATVQVGSNPLNTETVSVTRLTEVKKT
jgi:small acid-soluble spore protein H (minor)